MGKLIGQRVAIVSYRVGMADGVSVTVAQWATALRGIGVRVRLVAGEGEPDVRVPGLALDDPVPPTQDALAAALDDCDIVIADNVCSLPMNRAAGEAVAEYLRGRPAVLRHHDLPWERERYADITNWPPDDLAWRHVTVNEAARVALKARRGIRATTVYHGFAEQPCPQRRDAVREALGLDDGLLLLQPTRAIPRKNVHDGLALAEKLGATFWLTGPAEDGYAAELASSLERARVPVLRGLPDGADMAAAYAACDAVALPSSWEGFGLPLIESALHRRPIAVGEFPVAQELVTFGFRWFSVPDPAPLQAWLIDRDPALLDHNEAIAKAYFGIDALAHRLEQLLSGAPVCHHRPAHAALGTRAAGALDHDPEGPPECDCLTA